jgi:hypothetical protein
MRGISSLSGWIYWYLLNYPSNLGWVKFNVSRHSVITLGTIIRLHPVVMFHSFSDSKPLKPTFKLRTTTQKISHET